jgi:hypothetical protein
LSGENIMTDKVLRVLAITLALSWVIGTTGCGTTEPSQDTQPKTDASDTSPSDTGDTSSDTVGDTSTDSTPADTANTDTAPGDTGNPDTTGGDTSVTDTGTTDTSDVPPPECTTPCDCPQGESCTNGQCGLGSEAIFCCTKEGCPDGKSCFQVDGSAGVCGAELSPSHGSVKFNEVLTDGTTDGDPNGDGDAPDAVGDQFVEFVNTSPQDIDLSGWTLVEATMVMPRHTFGQGTVLTAGKAVVVFGGGNAPDNTDSCQFFSCNAQDPGIPFGLHLNNGSGSIKLLDGSGKLVASFAYGPGTGVAAVSDESLTRSPDLTGDWVPHSQTSNTIFSPGTKTDGTSF